MPPSPKNFVARGAIGSLAIKLATVGLAFIAQVLLARLMGADQYGIYIYALTWLNVLVLFGKLGTDGLLTRFAAAYTAKAEWAALKGLVRYGYRAVGVAGGLLAAGTGAALWAFGADLGPERYQTFALALLLLPVSAGWGVGQALLFGLKRPWLAQLPEPITRILMLTVAGIAYWHYGGLSAPMAMASGLVAGTLGLIIGSYWALRALPGTLRRVRARVSAREWFAVSMPLLFMAFLRLLLSQSDILLIGWLLHDTQAAGIYAVASRLAELTTFGLQAANTTLAPTISELYATKRMRQLQNVVTQSTRGVFAFTLATSLFLGVFGEWVLGLFGTGFGAAHAPLLILLVGQTVNAATGSVGYLMTMTGHQRQAAWMVALAAAATVALNWALIPRYGLDGAALASAVGTGVLNLAMLVFVAARLKINSTVFRSSRHAQS